MGVKKSRKGREEKRVKAEGERIWTEEVEGNEGRYVEGKKIWGKKHKELRMTEMNPEEKYVDNVEGK
jgi:hypothetical protein